MLSATALVVALLGSWVLWGPATTQEFRTADAAITHDGLMDWGSRAFVRTEWGAFGYLTVTAERDGFQPPWLLRRDWQPGACCSPSRSRP